MQLEQNQISRDWTILHNGRRFYVNYTDSDGQTLALLNRNNWEVSEEIEGEIEELNIYVFNDDTPEQRKLKKANALLKEEMVKFCIENWDNQFMHEIKGQMQKQAKHLEVS